MLGQIENRQRGRTAEIQHAKFAALFDFAAGQFNGGTARRRSVARIFLLHHAGNATGIFPHLVTAYPKAPLENAIHRKRHVLGSKMQGKFAQRGIRGRDGWVAQVGKVESLTGERRRVRFRSQSVQWDEVGQAFLPVRFGFCNAQTADRQECLSYLSVLEYH